MTDAPRILLYTDAPVFGGADGALGILLRELDRGLDVAVAIGESIGAEVPDRVRELIADGKLGRKAGEGFYEYDR